MNKREIEKLKSVSKEIKAMFLQCMELQDELNQTSVGIAGNEMGSASRHLDMAMSFIQESLDESNED